MITPISESIAKKPGLMTSLFVFEVLLFVFTGIAIMINLFYALFYFVLGIGDAYILGKAIEQRAINLYQKNGDKKTK